MFTIHACINIQCSPPVERFSKTVIATLLLLEDASLPSPPFRLLQSNYMSNWVDITDQPTAEVTSSRGRLTIRTDYTGLLAVAVVTDNRLCKWLLNLYFLKSQLYYKLIYSVAHFQIIHKSLHSFHQFQKINMVHIIKLIPQKVTKRISFPHSFKAYKGHRMGIELQGRMKPDGNGNFVSEYHVDGSLEIVMEKSVFKIHISFLDRSF